MAGCLGIRRIPGLRAALHGVLVLASAAALVCLTSLAPVAHAGGRTRGQFAVSVRVVSTCSIAVTSDTPAILAQDQLVHVTCKSGDPYTVSYQRAAVGNPAGVRSGARYVQSSGRSVPAPGSGRRVVIVTVDF